MRYTAAVIGPRPAPLRRRRGVASVLAMLYLVIFATLALGFYGAVTTATQVAYNDERSMAAQIAAESGLNFVRYQLDKVRFPSNTPPDQILKETYNDLRAQTLNSPNMGGHTVELLGDTIYFPASADNYFIPMDASGNGFRATMRDMGSSVLKDNRGTRTVRTLKVLVVGRHAGSKISRAIEMDFIGDYHSLSVFDFAIATKGTVAVGGSGGVFGPAGSLQGSILTTSMLPTPVSVGATVAGDLYLVNEKGNVTLSNSASVGGTSGADKWTHVRKGVDEPEFPKVDAEPFRKYAVNKFVPGQATYTNTYIPANTNPPPFSGKTVLEGVTFIEPPNTLKFNSQVIIKGLVVVAAGAKPGSANQIEFGGGMDAMGLDTLPDSTDFPPDMKKLKGSVLLAPGFGISLRGGAGTIGGTILADSFDFGGGSGGVVKGNIIGVGTGMGFNIGGTARIDRTRADEVPAGVILDLSFHPKMSTYTEVVAN